MWEYELRRLNDYFYKNIFTVFFIKYNLDKALVPLWLCKIQGIIAEAPQYQSELCNRKGRSLKYDLYQTFISKLLSINNYLFQLNLNKKHFSLDEG